MTPPKMSLTLVKKPKSHKKDTTRACRAKCYNYLSCVAQHSLDLDFVSVTASKLF